jgi:hypothetical protein
MGSKTNDKHYSRTTTFGYTSDLDVIISTQGPITETKFMQNSTIGRGFVLKGTNVQRHSHTTSLGPSSKSQPVFRVCYCCRLFVVPNKVWPVCVCSVCLILGAHPWCVVCVCACACVCAFVCRCALLMDIVRQQGFHRTHCDTNRRWSKHTISRRHQSSRRFEDQQVAIIVQRFGSNGYSIIEHVAQ